MLASLLCITIRIILESWLVYWAKTARGGDHRIICLPSSQKYCQPDQQNTWCIKHTVRQTHKTPGALDRMTETPTKHLVHQTD